MDMYCDGCPKNIAGDQTPNACSHFNEDCPFQVQIDEWNRLAEEERKDMEPPPTEEDE